MIYKSLDVLNSGGGVVPNSVVYKYSDPSESLYSAYDITSGVHTNAHEDAFSAPRTNVRLVAVFGAFKVPRVHSCALHL